MSTRLISATAIAAAFMCTATISPVTAADPGFCRGYANAALNQVRAGLSLPACRNGMEGPRWSSDFHVHFDWCLGASRGAADDERAARRVHLDRCRYR